MYWKQVWNKSQTYFDGRFNSGAFFIYLTVRPSTDGKRAPLTAINLQAAGSPQQAPPTYIAKMWKLIKFIKNVIFWRNHTDINPDDWIITKKTIRTTIHENFSKMKNSKVDRWALSLNWLIMYDDATATKPNKTKPCLYIKSSPPSAIYMRQWTGPSLVQVMACRLFGAKPLPEPMLVYCPLDPWEQVSVKF